MLHVDPAALSTDPITEPSPRAVIGGQLSMLTRLAEIGMEIAEEAGRRAKAAPEDGGGANQADPALAYARAARAVRLTIALQSRLLGDLAALDRAETRAEEARVSARRTRAQRLIERTLEARRDDPDEVERLGMATWERLTDEDDADIAGRPLEEIVALICRDLGLSSEETAAAVALAAESADAPAPPAPAAPYPFASAMAARSASQLAAAEDIQAESG